MTEGVTEEGGNPFDMRIIRSKNNVLSVLIHLTVIVTSAPFLINLKSASNLNGNLNCSKELEHYAS